VATDSDLDRTEAATSARIAKAYEEGDVPRSKELASGAVLFAAGLGIYSLSGSLQNALKSLLSDGLKFDSNLAFDTSTALDRIYDQVSDITYAFIPLLIFLLIGSLIAPLLVGGWNISPKLLVPNITRLDPVSGFSNIFNKNSLVELVKSILKVTLIGSISYLAISFAFPDLINLAVLPIETGLSHTGIFLFRTFFLILISYVVIIVIDVPYQLHRYAEKLKMSKEEIKQEMREGTGSPEIRGKIRQQQRAMSRRRMMTQVQNADVVITNPTHYAVAVQYSEDDMSAPIVLAKGSDAVALRIKELAKEHEILTVESPKLARALYAHTEVDQEIPEALYLAVAEILAFVFQVKQFNGRDGAYPNEPSNVEVPDELDPHFYEHSTAKNHNIPALLS
jgi:flagellar biosynthetic protein FlhB